MSLWRERSLELKIRHAAEQVNGGIDELIHRRYEIAAGMDMASTSTFILVSFSSPIAPSGSTAVIAFCTNFRSRQVL